MSIIRTHKNKNFTVLDNTGLRDKNLTWQAKGMLSYLLSLPDDWKIYVKELSGRSKNGRDATGNILKELINKNYIVRSEKREKGKFKGHNYDVYEKGTNKPKTENPDTVNPDAGKPDTENPTLLNTDFIKNEFKENTEKSKKEKEKSPPPSKDIFNEIQNDWNELADRTAISKVNAITKSRKNKIKKRLQESEFNFEKILKEISETPFLQGNNNRGWKVSFDWIIKNDDNYIKIIEGNYKNKSKNGGADFFSGSKWGKE